MDLDLGEHFEALIRRKVESGRYLDAAEVVRQALRDFERYENPHPQPAGTAESQANSAAGRCEERADNSTDEIAAEASR